jgi:hypothetical protein
MINLSSVRSVYVIGSSQDSLRNIESLKKRFWPNQQNKQTFTVITTDNIKLSSTEEEAIRKGLGPLFDAIERKYNLAMEIERNEHREDCVFAEHKADPKIVFFLDTSNKTASALARLFQGPWGGYPFAAKCSIAL